MTSPTGASLPPSPLPRSSLLGARPEAGAGAGAAAVEPEGAVEAQVSQELFRRLVGESQRAEIAHVVILGIVASLLWSSVSPVALGTWAAALVFITAARRVLRHRINASAPPVDVALTRIRLALAASGLAWGVGAAAFMPGIPLHKTALLLVVLCGLAAGGVATLAADLWSFRYFIAGLLAPAPVGILQSALQRDAPVAIVMVALFGAAMIVFHRGSHQLLYDHLRQSAERTQSERKAVRDRAYLDALLAGAPVAMVIIGADKRILGVNTRFESLFGYTATEAAGRNLNDLIVPPAEKTTARQLEERAHRGETVVTEAERRHKNGSLVPVRVSAAEIAEAEGGLLVLYEDITERRRADEARQRAEAALSEAERHYRELVESASDLVWQVDAQGRWTYLNAAAETIYGIPPRNLVGRPFAERVDPAHLDQAAARFAAVLGGADLADFETVHRDAQGAAKHLSYSAKPVRDATGVIVGALGTARDVTARVAAERALREARDAAQRLAQTRSAFLANMSHEIRTPMNAILGLTELLLDTELAPEQRHSLGLVQTSAETLLTLINDILDLSKIEAEHLQLESIPFDLPHLVDSTMGLLAVRARERRLELLADVGLDAPRMVRGDPTRLRQILTNLIGNAIKFTHQGEIVVSATRADTQEGRALMRFAVRDTGIGIPRDKLGTIFEEFSQADASTTRKYGGTGLGLAIARRLVRLMGGELSVASEVGTGTEFSFTLPLEVETVAPAPVAPLPGSVHLAGRRALVVDDNATNRRIVRDMLAAAGIRVGEARDGAAGLAALRSARDEDAQYELAIIDAQMPELDGFALAAAVRNDPAIADTRLVMFTSAGQRGDGQRCRELGIDGYLSKPASRSDLIETVSAVLGAPAAQSAAVVTRHSIAESRRRLQILLAEDNAVNQEVAAAMLRKRGHDVDVAGTGRAAVEAAAGKRYDLILMDIQMPEMDGFEATHAIRATPEGKQLPIIALTAHALSGERERCLSHGMNGYLTKPYKAHELFATVEGWSQTIAPAAEPAPATATPPPVDLETFRQEMRAAGAEAAVDPVLDTFLQTAAARVGALTTALATGAANDIERAAHAYRSAAATIGAKGLAALLQQLEVAGKAGDVAAARELGDRLTRESEAVTQYLRQDSR